MSFDLPEPVAVTLLVIEALDQLDIPYVLVGSLASSQHGLARSTLDSDLVVVMDASQAEPLVSRLQDAFYVDEEMVLRAIENHSSFNLIHLETIFKVDLFIASDTQFDRAQFERREARTIARGSERTIYVLSAEDTLLSKLKWYRLGGDQSEQQWRDVEGIVRVQGRDLDTAYMSAMAATLGIEDLLNRLLP